VSGTLAAHFASTDPEHSFEVTGLNFPEPLNISLANARLLLNSSSSVASNVGIAASRTVG